MEQALTMEPALAERLRGIKAELAAPSYTEIARISGINRVTISGIANSKMIPTPVQAERIWAALAQLGLTGEATDDAPSAQVPGHYKGALELYETKQYRDAMGWCEYIRSHRKMGVLIGHPGSGKTTLLREFVRRIPGARYIECWSTMRMGDLLGEIAAAAGAALSGNVYQRTGQVMRALATRDDVVLVLDEAEQLRKWDVDKFETLRKLWDNTGSPVILSGTMQLRNLLTRGGGRDNLAQLYRRKYEFELTGITEKEAKSILREYNLTSEAAAELARIATDARHGGMGNFAELLGLCLDAADGARIDAGVLAGAKQYKLMY
ncbi:MAG: ATP-binding protein [Clostridia bacterium]